jgi:hypothetical protein
MSTGTSASFHYILPFHLIVRVRLVSTGPALSPQAATATHGAAEIQYGQELNSNPAVIASWSISAASERAIKPFRLSQ